MARGVGRGLLLALLCLTVFLGVVVEEAQAQTTPTISPATLIEAGVEDDLNEVIALAVRSIPSDWIAPVNHALTGTGASPATIQTLNCQGADLLNISLETYDLCEALGSEGYDADANDYVIDVRASIDSHSDSGETFTVTLTDSSTPANTLSFEVTINDPPPVI